MYFFLNIKVIILEVNLCVQVMYVLSISHTLKLLHLYSFMYQYITHNYWSVNVNLFFLRIDCWICAEIVTSIVADN